VTRITRAKTKGSEGIRGGRITAIVPSYYFGEGKKNMIIRGSVEFKSDSEGRKLGSSHKPSPIWDPWGGQRGVWRRGDGGMTSDAYLFHGGYCWLHEGNVEKGRMEKPFIFHL